MPEKLIIDLDISSYIELLGNRTDIPDLLNKADLFVLSSKHEGLPTVLIEAMACETFVIATDCGGSAEILGDTGILVPVHDSEVLAIALEKAIALPAHLIKDNGKLARKRVEEKFSLQASVTKWLEIYAA